MAKTVLGMLAHVDAGKTTLSEAMLYMSGAIRHHGRVDKKDSFFDDDLQERQRGITIFSKQAEMSFGDRKMILVDTPGHADLISETERAIGIMDYAVLVIDARKGVQGNTRTLISLLERYKVPLFIFVNKTDIYGDNREEVLSALNEEMDDRCVDMNSLLKTPEYQEELAVRDEQLMEEYMQSDSISTENIRAAVSRRTIIPCYFGSALKLDGVDNLIQGIIDYTDEKTYPDEFGARVYKIARDDSGNRLTYMKITGGSLSARQLVNTGKETEKVGTIRIYSGSGFRQVDNVESGCICAVTSLKNTFPGQGLGYEDKNTTASIMPVLSYRVILPENVDPKAAYLQLSQFMDEEPELDIIWDQEPGEISIMFMGNVQIEILSQRIKDRLGLEVKFDKGRVRYKETVTEKSIGIGHFEPLRHYGEVHLLIEPGEQGSGIVFIDATEDGKGSEKGKIVAGYLDERSYPGVLTGSPLTDISVKILAVGVHDKHTEGGDLRQSAYRAMRNGVLKNNSILLEPVCDFEITAPQEFTGRIMSDITSMSGSFTQPEQEDEMSVIKGKAPAGEISDYPVQLSSFTNGLGTMSIGNTVYAECHNSDDVIAQVSYDPFGDLENTGDSVFCRHGSGVIVKWDKVSEMAHIRPMAISDDRRHDYNSNSRGLSTDDDLKSIFEKTYGKAKDKTHIHKQIIRPTGENKIVIDGKILKEHLIVDGYNIIYAWEELKNLAAVNLDAARQALLEILSNYQGYRNCIITVVFDAYKVKGGNRKNERFNDIEVVYTKEGETADSYIEKTTYEEKGKAYMRVATSDNLEQQIITGNGAFKIEAAEFKKEIEATDEKIREIIEEYNRKSRLNSKVTIGDKI